MPGANMVGSHFFVDTELGDRDAQGRMQYRKARWCETHDHEAPCGGISG